MGTTSSASTAYGHAIGKATGLKVDSDEKMYSFMAFKEDERSMGDVAWGTV